MPAKMRWLGLPGVTNMLAGTICVAWPGNVSGTKGYVGLVLFGVSLSLFWWAIRTNRKKPLNIAFTESKPDHLVQNGPYRLVRHPFYTSYIIGWTAAPIASGQYWLLTIAVIFVFLYYQAANFEESLFANSPQSSNYDEYRRRTGMFFPKLFRS